MYSIESIIERMTTEQRKTARKNIDDALDIVADITGTLPYSELFCITCAVMEKL